jgi:methionyl-tRNA synthetase
MSDTIPEPEEPILEPVKALDPPLRPEVTIDEFAALDFRCGVVVQAEAHPDADRLLVLRVDLGEAEPRQVVAGIRSDWSPEAIMGRTIIVAANLKPAKLRGLWSHGMILAVRGTEKVIPLTLDGPALPGTRVT